MSVPKANEEVLLSMHTLSNQKIGSIPRRQYSVGQCIPCQNRRSAQAPSCVPAPLMIEYRKMMLARLALRERWEEDDASANILPKQHKKTHKTKQKTSSDKKVTFQKVAERPGIYE